VSYSICHGSSRDQHINKKSSSNHLKGVLGGRLEVSQGRAALRLAPLLRSRFGHSPFGFFVDFVAQHHKREVVRVPRARLGEAPKRKKKKYQSTCTVEYTGLDQRH